MTIKQVFFVSLLLKKVRGRGGGANSRGACILFCYFGQEGGCLFRAGCLLEHGRLFEEIQYPKHCLSVVLISQNSSNINIRTHVRYNISCNDTWCIVNLRIVVQNIACNISEVE